MNLRNLLTICALLALGACSTGSITGPIINNARVAPLAQSVASHILLGALINPNNSSAGKTGDDGARYIAQVPAFVKLTGVRPALLNMFVVFGDDFPTKSAQAANQMGAVPFITLRCDDVAKVAAGVDDAYYRKWFGQAAAYGKPVYVRTFHEMNLSDIHSCATQAQPALFVTAFQRIYTIAHKAAPNVKIVWCPSANLRTTDRFYPGDAYVDVIAADHYANRVDGSYEGGVMNGPFPAWFAYYRPKNKPMMIAETAATQPFQADYIASLQAWLPGSGVSGMLWWDSQGGGAHFDFSWNFGAPGAAAWRAMGVAFSASSSAP